MTLRMTWERNFTYTVEKDFAKDLAKKFYIYSRESLYEVLDKEILHIQ